MNAFKTGDRVRVRGHKFAHYVRLCMQSESGKEFCTVEVSSVKKPIIVNAADLSPWEVSKVMK